MAGRNQQTLAGRGNSNSGGEVCAVADVYKRQGLRTRVRIESDSKLLSGRDVAISCMLGAEEFGFGTTPVSYTHLMSDSNGYVYDPNGIDLAYVKDLKEVRRGRIKEYAETHAGATYVADCTQVDVYKRQW